jgi:dipeptidase E
MRLYLSSYRMGGGVEALKRLLRGGRRVGIVENALDHIPLAERMDFKSRIYDSAAVFRSLRLEVIDLDLRSYFGSEESLRRDIDDLELIWAIGGNAFLLRKAMASSGLDRILRSRLEEDTVAYGGFSAGAVVLAPSLKGIELIDAPDLAVAGYQDAPIWEGLGVLAFNIVPHYRSAHKESPMAEELVGHYQRNGTAHLPLSDGEVLVIDGEYRGIISPTGRTQPDGRLERITAGKLWP